MAEYDRFLSLARRITKGAGDKPDAEIRTKLHDAFVFCNPQLPEDLKHDIAYYFERTVANAEGEDITLPFVEKLKEVLYLFDQDYDRVEETFSRDDWEYLKDVISDFALEIEQRQLTYIMQRITSRGIIDGR